MARVHNSNITICGKIWRDNLLHLHVIFMQAPVGMEAYRLSYKDKVCSLCTYVKEIHSASSVIIVEI